MRSKRNVWLAIFAFIVIGHFAFGEQCITTGTGAFNVSSASAWICPTHSTPQNGDTVKVMRGPATFDYNVGIGVGAPMIPAGAVSVTATGGGATGGSLGVGTYKIRVGYSSANGAETHPMEVSVTVASGNIPRVTFPAAVTGGSVVIYMTAAGGGTGTETLYSVATNCTTTTCDLTGAQSAGAAMPLYGALWTNSSVIVGTGITLGIKGNYFAFTCGTTLTGMSDSILEIDASTAVTPASQNYRLDFCGNSFGALGFFVASGTSAAHPFILQSNSGGGNARIAMLRTDNSTGTETPQMMQYTVPYMKFIRIGDATHDALRFTAGGLGSAWDQTFTNVTFDGGGQLGMDNVNASEGYNLTNVTFKNTLGTKSITVGQAANPNSGKLRQQSYVVYDQKAIIAQDYISVDHTLFYEGYTLSGGGAAGWTSWTHNLVRQTTNVDGGGEGGVTNSTVVTAGSTSHSYYISDSAFPSNTALYSGTANGGSTTTLTVAGTPWSTNAYQSLTTFSYGVIITGGTGVGQAADIASNTSSTLTLRRTWSIVPDATTTFSIYRMLQNPHVLTVSTGTLHTGHVFDFIGVDDGGDCILSGGPGPNGLQITFNIEVPNLAREGTCNFATPGTDASHIIANLDNNTHFTYTQTIHFGDYSMSASSVTSFKNNLSWGDVSSPAHWKAADIHNEAGGGSIAYTTAAAASNNACWNCSAGAYSGNGYNYNTGGSQAGANDVNVTSATMPFVGCSDGATSSIWNCNFLGYARANGVTGHLFTQAQTAWTRLMKVNDFVSPETAMSIDGLYTFVTNGYKVTDSRLNGAAFGGGVIGAMGYQPIGSIRHKVN